MKSPRNYLKDPKGIQTILAALLMVVIVVVAAVMVYAWSTGLLGTLLVNPNNNKEGPLSLDTNAVFTGTNNVTLYIRNGGSLSVALTSYYITDSSGDTWQALTWSGPTIAPNAVVATTLTIGTSTSQSTCAYSYGGTTTGTTACSYVPGSSTFTSFASGAYTIKVITSRNNPFPFPVTK